MRVLWGGNCEHTLCVGVLFGGGPWGRRGAEDNWKSQRNPWLRGLTKMGVLDERVIYARGVARRRTCSLTKNALSRLLTEVRCRSLIRLIAHPTDRWFDTGFAVPAYQR